MLVWIAEKLVKIGGGQLTVAAVKEFLDKVDKDDELFSGKQYCEKRGHKRELTGAKSATIERSAKAHKAKGGEVTYAHVVGNCKDAVKNPATRRHPCFVHMNAVSPPPQLPTPLMPQA